MTSPLLGLRGQRAGQAAPDYGEALVRAAEAIHRLAEADRAKSTAPATAWPEKLVAGERAGAYDQAERVLRDEYERARGTAQ